MEMASLALALAIAVALDLPSLRSGLWVDEWYTLDFAGGSFGHLVDEARVDPSPPGFYVLMWGLLRVLPANEWTVRLPSFLAHLALVWVVHRYARKYHDPSVAAIAAVALAANPTMAWYASNGRTYALTALVAMLCVEAYRDERWRRFGVLSGLGVWLHYGAALCPMILVAWDLARRRRAWTPAFAAALAAGAACLPLVPHFFGATLRKHPAFEPFDLGAWLAQLKFWMGLDAVPGLAVIALVAGLFVLVLARVRACALEAALWLGTSTTLAVFALRHGSAYHPKFILWTLPVAQVALAAAFGARAGRAAAVAWVAVVLASGWSTAGREKAADRPTAVKLAALCSPRDRVVMERGTKGAFGFHFVRMPRTGQGPTSTWIVHDVVLADGTLKLVKVDGLHPLPAGAVAPEHTVLEPR